MLLVVSRAVDRFAASLRSSPAGSLTNPPPGSVECGKYFTDKGLCAYHLGRQKSLAEGEGSGPAGCAFGTRYAGNTGEIKKTNEGEKCLQERMKSVQLLADSSTSQGWWFPCLQNGCGTNLDACSPRCWDRTPRPLLNLNRFSRSPFASTINLTTVYRYGWLILPVVSPHELHGTLIL
jgi:hypothetical protein